MPRYVYTDEDDSPMYECDTDRMMEYTVYSSRLEMKAYENGDYDYKLECLENARDIRRSQKMAMMMDEVGIENECYKCPYMTEILEEYEDEDFDEPLPEETVDSIKRMCEVCRNTPPEEREEVLYNFIQEVMDGG